MNWSFGRYLILFILVVILLPTVSVYATSNVTPSSSSQNCTTIDSNWKEYKQRILGANSKVSDVVLNACVAIGGGCNFISGYRSPAHNASIGGAKQSQHMQARAIDLRVPSGKEKEFLTLTICGLRKVNNCQGGLGYYKSKSIHVDVRTGTSNVWSTGFSRVDIAQNVSDPQARSILYGFGDGKCTGGSISGDYSEEPIYGPTEQNTQSGNVLQNLGRIVGLQQQQGGGVVQQLLSQLLNQQTPYTPYTELTNNVVTEPVASTTAGDTASTSLLVNNYIQSIKNIKKDSGVLYLTNSVADNKYQKNKSRPSLIEKTKPIQCQSSGFFGVQLFNTCKKNDSFTKNATMNVIPNKVVTSFVQNQNGIQTRPSINRPPTIGRKNTSNNTIKRLISNNQSINGNTKIVQGVVSSSGDVEVFYGFYDPNNSNNRKNRSKKKVPQQKNSSRNVGNYSQFSIKTINRGNIRKTSNTSNILSDSVLLVERGAFFGVYYGLFNGISPMIVGSIPRTLLRLSGGARTLNVYNLFSM